MKKFKPYLLGAAMAAAVLLVMGQAKAPEEPLGPRWEYLILENRWVSFKPLEQRVNGFRVLQDKVMNELGAEGWDLVQMGPGGYLFRRAR
jgi:hypothetical protein